MLRLMGVGVSATFMANIGKYCPVLVDLHVENCRIMNLTTVSSPTLTSLAIVDPRRVRPKDPCSPPRPPMPELAYEGKDCHHVAAALATGIDLLPLAA